MPENEQSLEQTIERLETILEELESGEADLEKSIHLYAEGKRLGTQALKRLAELERKVQIVVQMDEQDVVLDDFDKFSADGRGN